MARSMRGFWLIGGVSAVALAMCVAIDVPATSNINAQPSASDASQSNSSPLASGVEADFPDVNLDAPAPDYPALGEAPSNITEPNFQLDRSSPQALLASLLAARHAQDQSALLRASAPRSAYPAMSKLDQRWAYRAYLMPSVAPLWDKIESALMGEIDAWEVLDDRALLALELGGALGSYQREFIKLSDGWYLPVARFPMNNTGQDEQE